MIAAAVQSDVDGIPQWSNWSGSSLARRPVGGDRLRWLYPVDERHYPESTMVLVRRLRSIGRPECRDQDVCELRLDVARQQPTDHRREHESTIHQRNQADGRVGEGNDRSEHLDRDFKLILSPGEFRPPRR